MERTWIALDLKVGGRHETGHIGRVIEIATSEWRPISPHLQFVVGAERSEDAWEGPLPIVGDHAVLTRGVRAARGLGPDLVAEVAAAAARILDRAGPDGELRAEIGRAATAARSEWGTR